MALVTYKDLCIDAVDPHALGAFYAQLLGLDGEPLDDGDMKLSGPEPSQTIWVNKVPEANSVKQRVHIDAFARSLDPFDELDRVTAPGQFRWTTFLDPEGGEFCVFVVDAHPIHTFKALEVDAADHASIAGWWADVFGAEAIHDDEGYSSVRGISNLPFEDIDFSPVPEPKTIKNRLHWDVKLVGDASIDDLLDKGATLVRPQDDEIRWSILADPEGNEFCVFSA